jgi:redox-sensing transcriptional repressor
MTKVAAQIPRAVVNRLSRYYFILSELMEKKIMKISSQELSRMMGITASQLRQDLSYFGEFGQRGYGYRVDDLFAHLETILGTNEEQPMVIVGAGNLGQALVQYHGFKDKGFEIRALFDINPKVIGLQVSGIPVLDVDEINDFIRVEKIKYGVIAVPKSVAQQFADDFTASGIVGIWNFAPMELHVPKHVSVENVNLLGSLLILSFLTNDRKNRPQ